MALAFIEIGDRVGDQIRFHVDIGTNRYFSSAVGDGERVETNGVPRLARPRWASPIEGPLDDASMGRAWIELPAKLFDREHRFVQLLSFRNRQREGPAVSDVVQVPPGQVASDGELPTLQFAWSAAMTAQATRIVPFAYRERPLDSAMFLDGLGALLGSVVPGLAGAFPAIDEIGKAVTQVIQGSGSPGRAAGGTPPAGADSGLQSMVEILNRIAGLLRPGLTAAAVPAASAAQGMWVLPMGGVRNGAASGGYSQAQIAPALMALLNPQTIQALTGAFTKIGELAIQNDQNLREWILKLNPGVDDKSLDQLLESLSTEVAQPAQDVPYRRIPQVKLSLEGTTPVTISGRPRVLYRAGAEIGFHVLVDTPRPIPGGMLLLSVKDPGTLRILVRKGFKLGAIGNGGLNPPPTIPRSLLTPLKPGKDYLLCATLVWKSAKGDRIGTSTTQPFALVGDYVFDRVEESGDVYPLNDLERHRDFWHKTWQQTFDDKVRSYELDVKYYYSLDPGASANARMETLVRTDAHGLWAQQGKLKSGLILSLAQLNSLLPDLAKKPLLTEKELDGLRCPDFEARLSSAARTKTNFRGRRGDSVALWVYPEVKLQRVILKQPEQVDPLGHVNSFVEHAVIFPLPATVHFIGASTQS